MAELARRRSRPLPCQCCFMQCEALKTRTKEGRPKYPCTKEMRVFASEHRDDPPGYVFGPIEED